MGKNEEKGITRDAGSAVNENEDHTAEDPGDSEGANSAAEVTAVEGIGLGFITDDRQNGDVEKQKSGDELGDYGSVKGPFGQLLHIDHWRRKRLEIVLPRQGPPRSDFDVVIRHWSREKVS